MSAQQITLQTFRETRLSTTAAGISAGNSDQGVAFARLLQSVGARAEEATRRERSDDARPKARVTTTDDKNDDETVAKSRTDERLSRTDDRRKVVATDRETSDPSANVARDDDLQYESGTETAPDTSTSPPEPDAGKAAPKDVVRANPTRNDDALDEDRTAPTNDGDIATTMPDIKTTAPTVEATTVETTTVETTVDDESDETSDETSAVAADVPPAIIPPPPPPPPTSTGDATTSAPTVKAVAPPTTASAPVDPNGEAATVGDAENIADEPPQTGTDTAFDELLRAMTATDDTETAAPPKAVAAPPAATDDTPSDARIAQAVQTTEADESVMRVVVKAESTAANEKARETETKVDTRTPATAPEPAVETKTATDTATSTGTDDAPRAASGDTHAANGSGARSSNGDSSSARDGSTKNGDPSTAEGTTAHTAEAPATTGTATGSATGTIAASTVVPAETPVVAMETSVVSLDDTTTTVGGVTTIAAAREADATTHVATARAARGAVAVPEQIATGIRAGVKSGNDSFTIQLRPKELGTIDIKLDIGKDGRVSASVAADSPRTLELLMRDQKGLEQALRDAGLQTDTGSLSFSLRGDGNQNGNQEARERFAENRRGWGRGGGSSTDEDDDLPRVSQAARTSTQGNGRLDVSV